METIDWSIFKSKYFKFVTGKEYVVHAQNARVEYKTFGRPEQTPRPVLVMDIIGYGDPLTGLGEEFGEHKEFSTSSVSFVEGIKPIIDQAIKEGREDFYCQVKKITVGEKDFYTVFSWNPPRINYPITKKVVL